MGLVLSEVVHDGDLRYLSAFDDDILYKITTHMKDPYDKLKDLFLKYIHVDQAVTIILSHLGTLNLESPSILSHDLPGINLEVKHPVTKKTQDLHSAIIDLNDRHKWTREKIADWIEETLDPEQIAFKPPEGGTNETTGLAETTRVAVIKRVLPG